MLEKEKLLVNATVEESKDGRRGFPPRGRCPSMNEYAHADMVVFDVEMIEKRTLSLWCPFRAARSARR